MTGGSWYNTRYSGLSQINTLNISQLGAAWVSEAFDEGATSVGTPVVVGEVMLVTAGRKVYALKAATGERIWTYQTVPDVAPIDAAMSMRAGLPNSIPNSRGVAIGNGLVFVGLTDGRVIALRMGDGELVWSRQTGADEPKPLQVASPAPTYINGTVLTGLSSGDANLRGRITALAADTGQILWQLFAIPAPGEAGHETWSSNNDVWKFGGGGVWTNAAVDPALGLAYVSTGNPVPAFGGDWRPGDNLYTCSVLAIEIRTGKIKWYYQLVHHDVFEADAGTPVVLYDTQVRGQVRKALGVLRSDGYLFQLDRETGQPILPVKERRVPQLESQKTSPTQPFPVGAESILMSCEEWRKEKLPSGFVLGCMWTPPASPPPSKDLQNVLAPFPSSRVSPMAYSPHTGYVYAQATSFLTWPRRSQDPYFLSFDTTVLNLPKYGYLAAIDLRTGRIAWKKSIYTNGRLPIYLRAGLLATAGGLLLRGSGDGNVEAYDATSGEVLWTFQTGVVDTVGSPATYEVCGEQHVAVSMGTKVWAFKLGGMIPPEHSRRSTSEEGQFAGPTVETSEIETTSLKRSRFGSGTRYFFDEFALSPSRARVIAGTKVMFVNNGVMNHVLSAIDGTWSTGRLSPTQEAWITFDKPGRHTYVCKNHPWTYGEIVIALEESIQNQASGSDGIEGTSESFAAQSARGRERFKRSCSSCHSEGGGGLGMVPLLTGDAFASRWAGATAQTLLERITTTMPQSAPGSLDAKTYLSILAYLLHINDMVAREAELPGDPEALTRMRLSGPNAR